MADETIPNVMLDHFRFYRSDAVVDGKPVYVLELRAREITIQVNMLEGSARMIRSDIGTVLAGGNPLRTEH